MSLLRSASPNLVCHVCQKFSPLFVLPTSKGLKLHSSFLPISGPINHQIRAFNINGIRRLEKDQLWHGGAESAVSEASTTPNATSTNSDAITSSTTVDISTDVPSAWNETRAQSALPWYLRQQASIPAQFQKPVEIPDLPPNPPPLLETLLEYISVTAGLDDIELLDLRQIDPPPALGPKLIMVFATARSEKHLHVSADRFCRYLRREHGLKANAAGLLGRNELKIKLRRKAKRMKMFANIGEQAPEGNIDDGIRTGWICCTISQIEAHPLDTGILGDNAPGFVGFRDTKPGINVVVQMFTEEKRAETDLETLWQGVLKTHERKNQQADEALRELEEDVGELENDIDINKNN